MAKVILSVKEFLKVLKVGDKFWHMTCCLCKPAGIEGPCTIENIVTYTDGNIKIFFSIKTANGIVVVEKHAKDLVNRWHGVFLSEKEANDYFSERKHAYETNPKLIREARQAEIEHEEMRVEMTSEDELHNYFW